MNARLTSKNDLYTIVPTLRQIEHNEAEQGQNLLRIVIITVL